MGCPADNCLSKASLPMVAFIAKVEGVVRESFSGGFAPRPPQLLCYYLAPPIQNVLCSPCVYIYIYTFFATKRITSFLESRFSPQF